MKDTLTCIHCGQRHARGALRHRARVTCRKCGKAFVVDAPTDPEPDAELPEPLADPAPDAVEDRTTPVGHRQPPAGSPPAARPPARGARKARSAPGTTPRRNPVLLPALAAGLVLALGAVAFALLRTDQKSDQRSALPDRGAASSPAARASDAARELYAQHLARAESASRPADRITHLKAAAAAAADGWTDAAEAARARETAFQKILAVDPDNEFVNTTVRGLVKYQGADKEHAGRWMAPDEARAVDERLRQREREAAERAEKAENDRWQKDGWTRSAWRVADIHKKTMPEGRKLTFLFDVPAVPRPYFLMIEQAQGVDPPAIAADLGPGLDALRREFKARYQHIFAAGAAYEQSEAKFVVPVLILAGPDSYREYRKRNQDAEMPSEEVVAAFYVPRSAHIGDYKGTLYVWRNDTADEFRGTVFHEATHQLMHYACLYDGMGPTPWLQEGIAEYFGAHERTGPGKYEFGKILERRRAPCRLAAAAWRRTPEAQREVARDRGYLTPRMLVELDPEQFRLSQAVLNGQVPGDRAVAAREVELLYAQGWALVHFCNTYEDGRYKKGFETFLGKELRSEAGPEDFGEALGLRTDADWKRLSAEFFEHCRTQYR